MSVSLMPFEVVFAIGCEFAVLDMAAILFVTSAVSRSDVTAEVYTECEAFITNFADERLGVGVFMLTPMC